jgi:hypothetical protein
MELAIANVFPSTTHRWGKWHVMKNMKEKLGTMYSTSEFRREFDVLVNGMMTMHV